MIMTSENRSEIRPGAVTSRSRSNLLAAIGIGLAGTLFSVVPAAGQSSGGAYEHVDDEGSPVDPIAILQKQLDSDEAVLDFKDEQGYLVSLLEALDIPVSSQGLIFSRTSLQTNLITPWTPRAVYYNDDVYIGYVQDSPILEIASIDPDDGGVFYTLEQDPDSEPEFKEEGTTCLMCHESRSVTDGVAGVMVRSVVVDRFGYPISPLHEGSTTDRTPLDRRFAGWYVTGTHEGGPHAGNAYAPVLSHEVSDVSAYLEEFDVNADGNVVDLEGRFDSEPYLTAHSDIVSLMVLTHQTRVHNLITVAHEAAKEAVGGAAMLARMRDGSIPTPDIPSRAQVRINGAVERMVRSMLFAREAPLPGPVEGTSGFEEEFEARGPFDDEGRSLREFDLEERLFRYPMSFLIYSDAFVTLPDLIKEPFYRRVAEILDGRDRTGEYDHLDESDRTAIREILEATKPEFLEFTEEETAR
ncbi:MAG: hypothetical protein U5R14_02255 [Gemmatimonadota bacterium]|nr:hypothetical protein [Gemmatimonadota bacterium]